VSSTFNSYLAAGGYQGKPALGITISWCNQLSLLYKQAK
jgi:hypothetical protein